MLQQLLCKIGRLGLRYNELAPDLKDKIDRYLPLCIPHSPPGCSNLLELSPERC